MPDIKYTRNLIAQLHEGQTDHSGKPYVQHPLRVARNVRLLDTAVDESVVMGALLHDTIEDCGIDEAYLRDKGYNNETIAIVTLLTKPENDPRSYSKVIDDIIASGNRGAVLAKMADNMCNLHPERVKELQKTNPEKSVKLQKRYTEAIDKLSVAAGINKERVFELINDSSALGTLDHRPA